MFVSTFVLFSLCLQFVLSCSLQFYILFFILYLLHISIFFSTLLQFSPRFNNFLCLQVISNFYNLIHTFTICSTVFNYLHSVDGENIKVGIQKKSVTKRRVSTTIGSAPVFVNFRYFYRI